MATDVMKPEVFLELVEEIVEKAKEEGDVFLMGDHTGDLNLGQSSADGAVAIRPEISFANETFEGEDGDVRPLSKSKGVLTKVVGISKEHLSEKAIESIEELEEDPE